jgi:hypothetical protein
MGPQIPDTTHHFKVSPNLKPPPSLPFKINKTFCTGIYIIVHDQVTRNYYRNKNETKEFEILK